VNFVQFYIDGVLSQTIADSPYIRYDHSLQRDAHTRHPRAFRDHGELDRTRVCRRGVACELDGHRCYNRPVRRNLQLTSSANWTAVVATFKP
jgi:hypothetical protein